MFNLIFIIYSIFIFEVYDRIFAGNLIIFTVPPGCF